jgi:hypothetical protein
MAKRWCAARPEAGSQGAARRRQQTEELKRAFTVASQARTSEHTALKVVKRIAFMKLGSACDTWRSFTTERQRLFAKERRVVARMRHSCVVGAMDRWSELCKQMHRARRIAARIQRLRASQAFQMWIDKVRQQQAEELAREHEQSLASLRALATETAVDQTLAALQAGIDVQRASTLSTSRRNCLLKATRKLAFLKISVAMSRWAALPSQTRRVRRAGGRMQRFRLSITIGAWVSGVAQWRADHRTAMSRDSADEQAQLELGACVHSCLREFPLFEGLDAPSIFFDRISAVLQPRTLPANTFVICAGDADEETCQQQLLVVAERKRSLAHNPDSRFPGQVLLAARRGGRTRGWPCGCVSGPWYGHHF